MTSGARHDVKARFANETGLHVTKAEQQTDDVSVTEMRADGTMEPSTGSRFEYMGHEAVFMGVDCWVIKRISDGKVIASDLPREAPWATPTT